MIDIGLSKIAIIGVIALIVLGPERLPKVARTVGTLLGRAQRYISDVKSEVSREMDLDELRKMQTEVQDAAQNFESTVRHEFDSAGNSLNDALGMGPIEPAHAVRDPVSYLHNRPKRKTWRVRQSATPVWFRQASRKRMRVQSGAARVARYRVKDPGRSSGGGFS